MWWNKKQNNEVQKLLKELDLNDLSNLIEKAMKIMQDKHLTDLHKILEYVKPFIMKAIAKGELNGITDNILTKDFKYSLDSKYHALLAEEGINLYIVHITEDYNKILSKEERSTYQYYQKLPKDEYYSYISFNVSKK